MGVETHEAEPAATGRKGWKLLTALGLAVVFGGFVSYFLVFARFPTLRDFPWINLPLVALGLVLGALGARRAFGRPGAFGKAAAAVSFLLSAGIAGLFVYYVFVFSAGMPPPGARTLQMATAPDFTLPDQHGRAVTLSALRGKAVVLVFYRGHW